MYMEEQKCSPQLSTVVLLQEMGEGLKQEVM